MAKYSFEFKIKLVNVRKDMVLTPWLYVVGLTTTIALANKVF